MTFVQLCEEAMEHAPADGASGVLPPAQENDRSVRGACPQSPTSVVSAAPGAAAHQRTRAGRTIGRRAPRRGMPTAWRAPFAVQPDVPVGPAT